MKSYSGNNCKPAPVFLCIVRRFYYLMTKWLRLDFVLLNIRSDRSLHYHNNKDNRKPECILEHIQEKRNLEFFQVQDAPDMTVLKKIKFTYLD